MPITHTKTGATIFEGRDAMEYYRLVSLKQALKLEEVGIRMSRNAPWASDICRDQYNIDGDIKSMLASVDELIHECKSKITVVEET